MKTISIINLKGGVAKTLTADNMAHVLAVFHNKRVLLVDNDKQGNTSKAFGVHSYDEKSLSDILTARRIDPHEVIKKTRFQNIDVLPANMTLIRANLEVMMDSTRPQQTRLRAALGAVTGEYDYCIIDNAPDINISTINALVASDDVIIPIKIDKYAFDGLAELKEQIEDTRDDLNPRLRLAGCLITCFQRTDADRQGEEWLKAQPEYQHPERATESRTEPPKQTGAQAGKPISAAGPTDKAETPPPTEREQQEAPEETRCVDGGICPYCGERFDAAEAVNYSTLGTQTTGPINCPHCGKSVKIFCSVEYFCSPAEE